MGAHSFGHYVKTNASARELYRSEVEQATFERGHDGYNGTISTTAGVQEFSGDPLTEAEAAQRAEELIEAREVQKWGPAGALAVYEPAAKDVRKITRSIKLTGEDLSAKGRHGSLWQAVRELGDKVLPANTLRVGERLVDFEVVQRPNGSGWAEADATYKTRVVTEATEGAKQTRYFITGGDYDHRPRVWAQGFASQAEARAALDKSLRESKPGGWHNEASYGIVAESRRADGSPLVRSRREILGVTVKVEFTLVKSVTTPKRTGWYLFGLAAE